MKEIIELHERILARVGNDLHAEGVHFNRNDGDEEIDDWDMLPTDLQAEIAALRKTLDELLPEDFGYYAVLADEDGLASFGLQHDESPAGGTADGTFDPERSLFDQLRALDLDERRKAAAENEVIFDRLMRAMHRISGPLPSAKKFQRVFREETRDFIKEKRRDATQVHVMYWHETDGIMELDFPDGDALRASMPTLVGEGAEIVTIVAFGKPLSVERIDALKAAAIEVYADQPLREPDDPDESAKPDDSFIDVEAEIVEPEPVPPGGTPASP